MARVIIYDPAHENERVVNDLGYISASSYLSRVGVDVVIYGKGTTFPTLIEPSHLYWRHDAGEIRDMDAGEKAALDVEIAAAALASKRSGAKDGFESGGAQKTARRALLNNIVKDSIRWRTWFRDFQTEVAAATDLADFKVRVASLPSNPDITLEQAITVLQAEIDAGEAD